MNAKNKSFGAMLLLLALVLATAACSTTHQATRPLQPLVPGAGAAAAKSAVAPSPAAVLPDQRPAARAVLTTASPDETKVALQSIAPQEKPQALPAGVGEQAARPPAGDDGLPPPGTGWILPPDAVTMGPEFGPDISELDPNIPINMKGKMPEWAEEAERALREQFSGWVPMGEDVGPTVDLADPSTPPSSLLPISEFIEGPSRALGALSAGWQGYPASSPTGGPPDVHLAVGKDYIIAGYNSYYAVYNKGTGTLAASFNMSTLFSGTGTICGSPAAICDPYVLYDESYGGSCPNPTDPRYVLIALALNASNEGAVCIAVSKSGATPTSTANFWKYELNPSGTGFPDYPKVAAGPDALIIGGNYFGSGTPMGWAVSKSPGVYTGAAPTTREYTFAGIFTPWPANIAGCKQGQTPTYNGTHLASMVSTTNALQLWRWPVPSTSNNPATYGSAVLTATDCTNPFGSYFTNQPIDCMYGQWMDPEQRGDWFYAVHGTQGGAGAALGYAKINVSGASPGTPISGTVTETGYFLWMGSIAADRNYDFALAFSRASQTDSIYIGAALAGNEGGTWGTVQVAKAGEAQYNTGVFQSPSYRWGDYSGLAVDPEDGCTLWSNAQYARNGGVSLDDASWIRPYKFSGCSSAPQAFLAKPNYKCYDTISGSIIDLGGTPTNAVYHASNGNTVPALISGGPNNYTVAPITVAQLGAADGNTVWLSFTGSDLATHNSSNAVVGCAVNLCVSKVDDVVGGCDGDGYMDRGETVNIMVQFQNNETFALPTGFKADLRVDPAFPDANVTIVNATAEWEALDAGATGYPVGQPFQVRVTGGTDIRTVNFEIYNIRAVDGSWTGGSGCASGNLKFQKIANANNSLGASITGFPESFDGTTFPPTNWAQTDVVGTALNWGRSTATRYPTGGTTHSGAGLAYANCWDDPNKGDQVRLARSTNANLSSTPLAAVEFWMFHDTQYSSYQDRIQLQISTNGGGSWTDVGPTFNRTNLYGGANKSWSKHAVDVSAVAGGQASVRLGILAINDYGNDLTIDDVNFAAMTRVADTSTCSGSPNIQLYDSFYGYGYFVYDPTCNANYYLDAGESGTLLVYLSNTGNENAYGVTATLTCPSCPAGVTICKNTANYGTIPANTAYSYSQPDNGFQVALPTGLAAGSALPWVVTVNATNPYTTTVNIPTVTAGQSRSGTYTWVDNGDPNQFTIADYFDTAPNTSGTTGRYGFSTAWTTTAGVTRQASATLGVNVARLTGKSSTSPQTMAHTFSTAGINGDIRALWYFNMGRAATNSYFFFEWTNNGSTWNNFIPGGTGQPGSNAGTDQWVVYGYYSLYWITYNSTVSGYGPATADAMLNNASWGARFRCTYAASTNSYWEVWPMWLDFLKWENTPTSCTGACAPPEAPVINEVRDLAPCSLTGVQVYFDKGVGTVGTDLYRDGALAASSYTSGTTYLPGDNLSHDYVVRATNTFGTTDSSPATPGTDLTNSGQYFTCNPSNCTDTTSVVLTAPSGMSNYQWYRNGSSLGVTINTYTATVSGSYTVQYTAGACTAQSPAQTVTITGGSYPGSLYNAASLRVSKSGGNLFLDWAAPGGTCSVTNYGIYEGTITGPWAYNHTQIDCNDNGTPTEETITPGAGNRYYLVVPFNGTAEGSYGLGNGSERPRGTAQCTANRDITACN